MRRRTPLMASLSPRRHAPSAPAGALSGAGATLLFVAIFGRTKLPLRGADRAIVRRARARLRELALALLLAAGGMLLVVALRLALAARGSATLRDVLHAWLPHLT